MARLDLAFLGPLRIALSGVPVTAFRYDKVRALLIYLAAEGARAHRRETLAELLWPEQDERAARHSLSQALWSLRQAIEDDLADPPVLLLTRATVQFNQSSDHQLDLTEFDDLLDACARHAHRRADTCRPCAERLRRAIEIYRGDFLAQFSLADSAAFEEWALIRREYLRRRLQTALDQLIDYHERREDASEAIRYAQRRVGLDPSDEAAQRRLMRLLATSGQRSAALAQYDLLHRTLRDEMGVEPEEETTALAVRIREGAEERPARQEARGNGAMAPSGLPLQSTPFVGREVELTRIADLLSDSDCRLITLAGPGGIGKTRLAIQAASAFAADFADGVTFVPLAGLRSAAMLAPAIAETLSLASYGQGELRAQLLRALRERELLLVLDNFEHLLDGAALVAEILAHAPLVQILVTSRERLSLHGEWVIDLEGLDIPPPSDALVATPGGQIERYSAVQLFVQQARKVQWSFAPGPEELRAIGRICRLVAGMPLGIELAAAWAPLLEIEEIAGEIERGLDFLSVAVPVRDLPERHRSMRAVFDRSWEMLPLRERRALGRLSVFRGGFTRQAAEEVAGASLQVLSALMNKSLLRRAAGRYELHELLRQYAGSRLSEAHEADEARDRHCDYFIGFLSSRRQALEGQGQEAALAELGAEVDNLLAAWDWAVERLRTDAMDAAVHSLWLYMEVTGSISTWQGAFAAAVSALEGMPRMPDAIDAEEHRRRLTYGRLLSHYGSSFFRSGGYERGEALIDRSIDILRLLDAPGDLGLALNFKAMSAHVRQDYAREQEYLRQSVEEFAAAGDRWGMAYSLNDLGMASLLLGDYETADRLCRESLEIFAASGDKRGMAFALRNLGVVASRIGDAAARRDLWESHAIRTAIGHNWGIADSLNQLGIVARSLGEYDESQACLLRALRVANELQAVALALEILTEMAHLLILRGRPEQAAEILSAITQHSAGESLIRDRAARLLDELEAEPRVMPPGRAVSAIEEQIRALLVEDKAVPLAS